MKINVSVANCQMFVQGIDMNCPLCGFLVLSGTNHACAKEEPKLTRSRTLVSPKAKRLPSPNKPT